MRARMHRSRYAALLLTTVACTVSVPAALAQSAPPQTPLCASCHGANGISTLPETPSLAGQPASYLTLQLILFHGNQRRSPRMAPVAAVLSDADMKALGDYFSKLPAPAGRPDADDIADGRRLVDANHCASCHLDTFAGQNQMPRLADQREDYLLKAMRDFRDGRRSGLDGTMTEVLHGFSDGDLTTLAHYLSELP